MGAEVLTPQPSRVEGGPRHVAIVMDGNGRWANRRGLPRAAGHRAGVKATRAIVEVAAARDIDTLTLFAFSSENWQRPRREVRMLMSLFVEALQREVSDLHENKVVLRFIGQRDTLSEGLQQQMADSEALTRHNGGLELVVAVAYGGRWDIVQAARAIAVEVQAGRLDPAQVDERLFGSFTALHAVGDPDLLVRTGDERRVSNFLLWNLAYTELYFSDTLWPDFDAAALDAAIEFYAGRQRRFGQTAAQVASP